MIAATMVPSTIVPGISDLADRARVPYVDAPDQLEVLCDALIEAAIIDPKDNFFHEHEQAAERATVRARKMALKHAHIWERTRDSDCPDFDSNQAHGKYETISYYNSCRRAKEKGCEVVHPKDNELFLDIDKPEQLATFNRNFDLLHRYELVEQHIVRPSSSGHPDRFHITVTLKESVTSFERIALQAALGSDPMREMLSLMRIYTNNPHPTLFFEKASP